ncbi:MAG: IclR family transcriptional regulator, partial [Burkholderiales bacterium]
MTAPAARATGSRPRQRASDTPDPLFATTLARGLQLLDAFRAEETWLTNSELAARTGISRPTVSRLAGTLVKLGYLDKGSAGRYRLGMRLLGITYPLLARFRIRLVARPLMRDFAEQAGGAVSIGILEGTQLVYVETARSAQPFPHLPEVGFSCALYSTAGGRA